MDHDEKCKFRFNILWQQCFRKFKTVATWAIIYTNQYFKQMIWQLKAFCYWYEGYKQTTTAIVRVKAQVYTLFQGFLEQQGRTYIEMELLCAKWDKLGINAMGNSEDHSNYLCMV